MNTVAHWLGIGLQSTLLGVFLFWAILELTALTTGARVFHYQGF
jgi:hypothetical protein